MPSAKVYPWLLIEVQVGNPQKLMGRRISFPLLLTDPFLLPLILLLVLSVLTFFSIIWTRKREGLAAEDMGASLFPYLPSRYWKENSCSNFFYISNSHACSQYGWKKTPHNSFKWNDDWYFIRSFHRFAETSTVVMNDTIVCRNGWA